MAETVGGRYALEGRLGEGGMGHVYRARHLQLGKAFALKIISPAFADNTVARVRFNEEAKLASEISHPNIVSVVDFGEDDRFGAYMVMELVEGEPLVAQQPSAMSVRRACDMLGQIADALEHVHRLGIVHGDVKADNIMLASDKSNARRRQLVRLLDFGLARRPDGRTEEHVTGTPHYLAPERARGGAVSVSGDVYALGVLGYLLLTGTLPFDGEPAAVMMAHVHDAVVPPSQRRSEPLDEALEALILRALAKDPRDRHASAAAFRYELNAVMEMLELSRRRRSSTTSLRAEAAALLAAAPSARDLAVLAAFDRSRMPQVIVTGAGEITAANRAFEKLVGKRDGVDGLNVGDTSLATAMPGLLRAVRTVHEAGRLSEQHAQVYRGPEQAPLGLTLWLAPIAPIAPLENTGTDVHITVRVDELQ